MMHKKSILFHALFAATLAFGEDASAQISFNSIRPQVSPTFNGGIDKKTIHTTPIEKMAKPSISHIPMTQFKHHKITSDRIMMTPIERNSLKQGQMKMNQITFNPMIKTNIRPDRINASKLIDPIRTPKKMNLTPPIEKPHWSFNPTLQGHVRATTEFDSSVKAPMRDYSRFPTQATHPMAW